MSARKSKSTSPSESRHSLPGKAVQVMRQVVERIEEKDLAEALRLLRPLQRQYPNHPDILTASIFIYQQMGDVENTQAASEALLRVKPDHQEAMIALILSSTRNTRPATALRTCQRFLERWPDDPQSEFVRQTQQKLEEILPEVLQSIPLPPEQAIEVALQQEEMGACLARGFWAQGIRIGQDLLRRVPQLMPVLNNLALLYWLDGQNELALQTARRALEVSPHSVQALGNLIRFLYLSGEQGEARQLAEQMKTSPSADFRRYQKQAETLSLLGDDAGVLQTLQAFEQDQEERASALPIDVAIIYHLAAVAALRLGDEPRARKLWEHALQADPHLELAQENLNDLNRKPGQRNGPWAFELFSWLPPALVDEIRAETEKIGATRARSTRTREADSGSSSLEQEKGEALQRTLRQALERHPELRTIIKILLERGDPDSRKFAVVFASDSQDETLLETLRQFALGQAGSDEQRLDAAQKLTMARLLPSGECRLWLNGEWQDVLLFGFEIHDEPLSLHSRQVSRWIADSVEAARDHDLERSEELLNRALAAEPGAPDILNNLAALRNTQGREAESQAIIRQIFEQYPDYLFGQTNMARILIKEGQLERARQLLDPILQRPRLHVSEVMALCMVEIELALAQKNRKAARSWLGIWESTYPDHPLLETYRNKVDPLGWMRRPR